MQALELSYISYRCITEVGDVGVGTFKKLMSALVDLVMLYGLRSGGAQEVWRQ